MSFDFNMSFGLRGGSHLLRGLGLDADGFFGGLEAFDGNLAVLNDLSDSFQMAAMSAAMLANLLSTGGIPGAGCTMPPGQAMARCPCQDQYSPPQRFDFGASDGNIFQRIMARQEGANFERFLSCNPFARAQLGMMLGGEIVPDGRADGRITVQPFQNGQFPQGSAAASALTALNQITQAGMALGFLPGLSSGNMNTMFNAMVLGALTNLMTNGALSNGGASAGGLRAANGGRNPFVDWAEAQGQRRAQNGNQMFRAGGPGGDHTAGANHPAQGAFGLAPGGADETAAILNDSSLTVEDKVCLMLMAIMKKMDEEIEKQAQYVNSLQQQQSKKGGKGGGGKGGGKGGGGGGGSSPSIDVETMKLKRLIDKRGQMFDMLRQIIDKYNETAKNVIQSIGR